MLRYSVDRSSVDMVGGGWGPGAAGRAAVQGLVDEQVALNTVQLNKGKLNTFSLNKGQTVQLNKGQTLHNRYS